MSLPTFREMLGTLILAATCDEESSTAGGRFLLESGKPRAEDAIIGEPTGLRPMHAHKGFMLIPIQLEGAAGHSSNPALGHNALDAMHSVMTELIRFREELSRRSLREVRALGWRRHQPGAAPPSGS